MGHPCDKQLMHRGPPNCALHKAFARVRSRYIVEEQGPSGFEQDQPTKLTGVLVTARQVEALNHDG